VASERVDTQSVCGEKLVVVAKIIVKPVGGQRRIASDIAKAILLDINKALKAARPGIERKVKQVILRRLLNSSVVQDLRRGGRLATELGLPDAASRMERIIEIWVKSTKIDFIPLKKAGSRITGGLKIKAIDGTFSDVLGSGEAEFVTAAAKRLPWLKWLLLEGDKPIIEDFTIGVAPGRSRTGRAVMVSAIGKSWSVPPEFSGTINNNFVSRAMDGIEQDIEKILSDEINKRLR
jgi:hypothetical protein